MDSRPSHLSRYFGLCVSVSVLISSGCNLVNPASGLSLGGLRDSARNSQADRSPAQGATKSESQSSVLRLIGLRRGADPDIRANSAGTMTRFLKRSQPSNYRNWRPDLAVLPYAEIGSDKIKIYHVRDCNYRTEEDYDVRHRDLEFALSDVRSVDFIVVPFKNSPALAHTMLSFGLSNGTQIAVSVEGRLEQGEEYSAIGGSFDGFELTVVIGTERDLIGLRTEVRKVDVYLYRTTVRPEQAQKLLVAMLGRANELARHPEFYDTLTNNCTTNIVHHVNELRPGSIPSDFRVVLPGHSDRMAYDLGLIPATAPFEQVKAAARINVASHAAAGAEDFSLRIRGLR